MKSDSIYHHIIILTHYSVFNFECKIMCASISHAAYHNINLNYFLPHRKTNAKKKKPVKERKNRAHSLPHNVIHTQKKKTLLWSQSSHSAVPREPFFLSVFFLWWRMRYTSSWQTFNYTTDWGKALTVKSTIVGWFCSHTHVMLAPQRCLHLPKNLTLHIHFSFSVCHAS